MIPLTYQIDHGSIITQFTLSKVKDDLFRVVIGKYDKPEDESKRIIFNNTEIYLSKSELDGLRDFVKGI